MIRDICGVEDISFLFLAKHTPTSKIVSLRLTDLTISTDYEFIDEMIATVKNNKLIKHPNLMPHYISFIDECNLWTVTVPIHGTMRGIMKDGFQDGFSDSIVATILKETIKGLVYIHENHMIHKYFSLTSDIKADNILIDSHGEIRLSGFRQLTLLQQGGEVINSVFSLVGDNIEWAAPEVLTQVV